MQAIYKTVNPNKQIIINAKSLQGLKQKATKLNILAIIDCLEVETKTNKIIKYYRHNKKTPANTFVFGKWR